MRGFIVFKEQGVIMDQAHGQSLVGIKVKFQHLQPLLATSLGSMFLLSEVFILWGSASYKNSLGVCVCVRSLSLSGNWEFSDSTMW